MHSSQIRLHCLKVPNAVFLPIGSLLLLTSKSSFDLGQSVLDAPLTLLRDPLMPFRLGFSFIGSDFLL